MSNDQYALNDIIINKVVAQGNKLEIIYSTKLESLYYSPGALVQVNKGDTIISIVRCSINGNCKVDVKSTLKEGYNSIILDMPKGNIFLDMARTRKIMLN